MKILAFVNAHALAHVSRIVEISLALQKKSNCQIWIAGHGKYLVFAKKAGFETIELPYVSEEIVKEVLVSKNYKRLFPYHKIKEYLDADVALCEIIKPDLILSDNRITARTVGDLLKIPVYTVMNTHISPFIKTAYFNWASKFPAVISRLINHYQLKIEKILMDKLFFHGLKKIRKLKTLKPLSGFEHEQGHYTIIPDLPDFNPASSLPSSALFVGPITWKSTVEHSLLLKKIDKNKKMIFISLGSLSHQEILKRLTELGDYNYQFIIASGDVDLALPEILPANVFVEKFVDMDKVFPFCDAVVCHGGNGTIYQALKYSLPIVGIPKHDEQKYNVDLVIRNKVGLGMPRGESKKIHFKKLMKLIELVLTDSTYKINARKFRHQLMQFDGPDRSANFIADTNLLTL